jgi:hypothetical protein
MEKVETDWELSLQFSLTVNKFIFPFYAILFYFILMLSSIWIQNQALSN